MLYVVRHGRTASNASGLLLGRADPPLDEHGRWQAERAGDHLAALSDVGEGRIERIVTSPLARTRETAETIAARIGGVEVVVDERFVELDYGEWDQRPIGSVPPEQWRAWQADPAFAPPGGESLAELHDRVTSALDELAAEAAERHVAVVTHVSPIKSSVAWALGVGIEVSWRMFVTTAAISTISTAGGRVQLHRFNDTAHLLGTPPA